MCLLCSDDTNAMGMEAHNFTRWQKIEFWYFTSTCEWAERPAEYTNSLGPWELQEGPAPLWSDPPPNPGQQPTLGSATSFTVDFCRWEHTPCIAYQISCNKDQGKRKMLLRAHFRPHYSGICIYLFCRGEPELILILALSLKKNHS